MRLYSIIDDFPRALSDYLDEQALTHAQLMSIYVTLFPVKCFDKLHTKNGSVSHKIRLVLK